MLQNGLGTITKHFSVCKSCGDIHELKANHLVRLNRKYNEWNSRSPALTQTIGKKYKTIEGKINGIKYQRVCDVTINMESQKTNHFTNVKDVVVMTHFIVAPDTRLMICTQQS